MPQIQKVVNQAQRRAVFRHMSYWPTFRMLLEGDRTNRPWKIRPRKKNEKNLTETNLTKLSNRGRIVRSRFLKLGVSKIFLMKQNL